MVALTQSIYIAILSAIIGAIAVYLYTVIIGKSITDPSSATGLNAVIAIILALIAILAPAYLVIKYGWGA